MTEWLCSSASPVLQRSSPCCRGVWLACALRPCFPCPWLVTRMPVAFQASREPCPVCPQQPPTLPRASRRHHSAASRWHCPRRALPPCLRLLRASSGTRAMWALPRLVRSLSPVWNWGVSQLLLPRCRCQLVSPWWHPDTETLPHYWPFVRGIHQLLVDSPHKGLVIQIFDVYFVVSLNNLLNIQFSFRWSETPWRSL